MKHKRIPAICAILVMALLMHGCENKSTDATSSVTGEADRKPVIVTTIFPLYDWAKNIVGDHAEVEMLIDSGVDLHSFQPTAQDVLKIATCDLFLYVGGESDEWVPDALQEAVNRDMIALNMLEELGDLAKEEEHVEGMEEDHEHEEDHEEDHEDEHDHGEETEFDEHVWLSLRNAKVLSAAIADAVKTIDPGNAGRYEENVTAYNEKLSELDRAFEQAVSDAPVRTILFGDRFPFRYLTDDYGLTYYAAFAGCSAETEASFETIVFLSGKTDELGLSRVAVIDGSDGKIAETIIRNTSRKDGDIVTFYSMQNITENDVAEGADYLSLMEKNLEALKEVLR